MFLFVLPKCAFVSFFLLSGLYMVFEFRTEIVFNKWVIVMERFDLGNCKNVRRIDKRHSS